MLGVGEGVGGLGNIAPGSAAAMSDLSSTCIRSQDGELVVSCEDSLMVGRVAVWHLRLAPGG